LEYGVSLKAQKGLADIRRLIDSGEFPINTRLPAERMLARQLGISRGLLRDMLAKLEAEGRIWRHVGQGTFVGGRAPNTKSEVALISNRTSPAEVFEARLAIEPQCASHAALRATSDDISHIAHCIQKMDRAPNNSNYFRWDATLHRAIAEAARNSLLLDLYDAVNSTREQFVWSEMYHASMDQERREKTREQHHGIADAIRRRNAATAARITRQHIEDVRSFLLYS
jgi:DNA-binding FadR family transcriptional regulator